MPFRIKSNIASTGTDAEDMDRYSSASLLSMEKCRECCCHWQCLLRCPGSSSARLQLSFH